MILVPLSSRLRELVSALCDGVISDADFAELQASLTEPDTLRSYVRYLQLHGSLLASAPEANSDVFQLLKQFQPKIGTELAEPTKPRSPVLGFIGSMAQSMARSPLIATLFVAAGIYGVFAFLAWDLRPIKLPGAAGGNGAAVAIVSDVVDVKWPEDSTPQPKNTSVKQGELLVIDTGRIGLELQGGTMLWIEGPAQWSIDGTNAVKLHQGKLVARVPQQAIGFAVETPLLRIVDLGTEFVVEVDAAGRTDVEVIAGKVDVRYESSAKTDGSPRNVRMNAGAARRFSSGVGGDGVAVTPIAPWVDKAAINKNFARTHQEFPHEAKYAAAVLADQPLGYWRLSDKGKGIAADASGHDHGGQYRNTVSTSNPGICRDTDDQSVRFLGPNYAGSVEIADFELPPSYTIEMWARSATSTWNATGWLLSSQDEHEIIVAPLVGTRQWQFFCLAPDGYHHLGTHQPHDIADRFHQYVCAYDAETDCAWMYFDGALVNESSKVIGSHRRQAPRKLTLHVGRDCRTGNERCGDGWIDELAIYPRVLDAAAIHRHFDAVAAELTLSDPPLERD